MSINVVTFEADAQRQHQRYKLPLKCIIDGYRYSCFDWSVGGAGVATGRTVLPEFQNFPIELEFPFDHFVISIKQMAQVRYCDTDKGRTGLQYVSPTEANLRFFRYIRDAYINGDLVAGNEVIDFSSRMIEPRNRKKGNSAGSIDAAPAVQDQDDPCASPWRDRRCRNRVADVPVGRAL
jgi:alginate biosynthesis protein Alg44